MLRVDILRDERERNDVRWEISLHEMVARYPERDMAWPSAASDSGPYPNGDVARRAHIRFTFAMPGWGQRYRPLIILRHRLWPRGRACGRADWIG